MGVIKDYVPRVIPGLTQKLRVTLTSAQILALNTTPAVLIGAPPAGKYISVDEVLVKAPAAGSVAYTGANAVELRYTNGAGSKATGDYAAASLNSIVSQVDKLVGAALTAVPAAAPIVASVPTANPAAGNGTVTFDISYRVVGL